MEGCRIGRARPIVIFTVITGSSDKQNIRSLRALNGFVECRVIFVSRLTPAVAEHLGAMSNSEVNGADRSRRRAGALTRDELKAHDRNPLHHPRNTHAVSTHRTDRASRVGPVPE